MPPEHALEGKMNRWQELGALGANDRIAASVS